MTVTTIGSRTVTGRSLPRPLVDIRGLVVITEATLDAFAIEGIPMEAAKSIVTMTSEVSVPLMPLSGRWGDTTEDFVPPRVPPLNMEGFLDIDAPRSNSFPALRGLVSEAFTQPTQRVLRRLADRLVKKTISAAGVSKDVDPVSLEMILAGGAFALLASASTAGGMIFMSTASISDGSAQKKVPPTRNNNQGSKGNVSRRLSLLSGAAIKGFFSGPLGPVHTTWAFLRYWEAQSLVRGGRIDEAIKSYDSAIAAFERVGAYGYVGQTAAIKGFAVLHVDMGKEEPGDVPGTKVAREAFRAFKQATDAYEKIGSEEFALICMEMMARISRGVTTRASIMSHLWDLPIHDGAGVPDADLDEIAKKLGGWWLSPRSVGTAMEYGVPLAIGELPIRLIQKGLIQILGRDDLAEKIEMEPLRREVTKEIGSETPEPTINEVQILKWLNEHMKGWESMDNRRAELKAAVTVVNKKLEDPVFRSRFVRRLGGGAPFVINAGIHEALREHYGLYKEVRELPSHEVPSGDGDRLFSSTQILSQVLKITNVGGEIDRMTRKVGEIVVSPEFPDRYFENGELTELGLNEALRIVTGGKVIIEDTIDETEFEAGEGVTETRTDDILRVKVRAPMRAVRAIFDGRDVKGVRYPRWGNYGEEMKQHILQMIGRQISQMDREGRAVIVPVAGVGVEINLPMLRLVIEKVQQQIRIEKILNEQYPDLKKGSTDHYERVVAGVIGILNRRSFSEQLDEVGTIREDLVIDAYGELLNGDARESESAVDTEPDSHGFTDDAEGPTEEVDPSTIVE